MADESALCRCGHPKAHHDANECWTTPDGQETYGETSCRCSGFELAGCTHQSVTRLKTVNSTVYNACTDCGARWVL